MLEIVNGIGRCLVRILVALSWTATGCPRARNFTLAAGSLVLGLVLGSVFYFLGKSYPSFEIDRLNAFVLVPAGAIILTFAVEGIKKEIKKNDGQLSA